MSRGRTQVDPLGQALKHHARVALLRYLDRQGPERMMCVRELSEDLGLPREIVRYHVQVLDENGAIRPAIDAEPAGGSMERFYVFNVTDPEALAVLREGTDATGGRPGEDKKTT